MKWWHRLSFRVTVFILLLAIVPLAGFGITTINDIRRVRLQSLAEIHKGIATHSAHLIEDSLAHMIKSVQLIIETNELETVDVFDKEWFLQQLLRNIPHLYSLTLTDATGKEMVKVGRDTVYNPADLETREDYPDFEQNADHNAIIGETHSTRNNFLVLDVFIPMLSPMDRHVTGALVAEVDVEKLLSFTADLRLGTTGYVYVVNTQGKILVHPDHSVVLAGKDDLANPLVKAFVAGQTAFVSNQIYTNGQQGEVMTNVRATSEPKLLVVVVQSVTEALAAVTLITHRQTILLAAVLGVAILLSFYFTLKTIIPLRRLESGARRIGEGILSHRIPVTSSDELGSVARSFNGMARELEMAQTLADDQNWLKQGVTQLDNLLRGDQSLEELCSKVITFMARYLEELVGVIYVHDGRGTYRYVTGYAFQPGPGFCEHFQPGQGLAGQAVLERQILNIRDIPADYISITSGLGSMSPWHLNLVPFVYNDGVEAVMELGGIKEFTELKKQFLIETADTIAIILASARSRRDLNSALVHTRQQAEELQRQQKELQAFNEEMEEQTQMLLASESKLKEQQEELQAANEELEEKTQYLERNKKSIEEKNHALETLRRDLEKKAADLTTTSKYKSEFLANMSHELRTPLNSLLLLSRMLADNKEGNLLEDQVDSAQIIHNSGNDLLHLINEILDLSKIEAGKMELHMGDIELREFASTLEKNFKHLAREKDLSLNIVVRDNTPDIIVNDRQRVEQVLKNFLSNAFKFTNSGGVTVEIYRPEAKVTFIRPELNGDNTIAMDVRDTGIGIPRDKQTQIFEAFQQLETGTARKYGGTGLGLSISREIAHLLGGEVHLQSEENKGSVFTLFLPLGIIQASSAGTMVLSARNKDEKESAASVPSIAPECDADAPLENSLADDRDDINDGDKTILIVEDDLSFATTLLNFCREKGFKGLVSLTGEEGLKLVERYPLNAIILDIHLPGIDGWTVLEYLKDNPSTRHIPVHFMSADDPVPEAFAKGAIGYLTKPVNREDLEKALAGMTTMINKKMKDLLLVEDDSNQRQAITRLIDDGDVAITQAATGNEAMAALRKKPYDCMILDLGLPDMSGFDLLKLMENTPDITFPPVVVYTGKELTVEEEKNLRRYSEFIIIKGVRSQERLLDETSLFLHRMVEKMPEDKRKIISDLHDTDQMLRDRRVLIVDDDMRNVFALAKVLNDKGIHTIKAENGIKALEVLAQRKDVDLVLMDIMMPVMDGYETMKKIREQSCFSKLPIIALTAKAMHRDKDASIAAGANDYLTKPVDIDRLLSMMRVWLYR